MLKIFFLILVIVTLVTSKDRDEWDDVVIGTGNSGSAYAGRVSADPNRNVLVLEEGYDQSDQMSNINGFYNSVIYPATPQNIRYFGDKFDHVKHLYSTEGPTMGFRHLYFPRPRLAGGGSSLNGEVFARITAANLARWNSSLWTYDSTLADWNDFVNFVGCVAPTCNTTAHATTGNLKTVSIPPDPYLALAMKAFASYMNLSLLSDPQGYSADGVGVTHRNIEIINGVKRNIEQDPNSDLFPYQTAFGFNINFSSIPYPDGYGPNKQGSARRNVEDTSSTPTLIRQDAYSKLLKPYLNRTNLQVIFGAKVLGVEIKANGKHIVKYLKDGQIVTVKAKQRVSFAAGAINTAQLIQLSGIGNCTELETKGIDCEVENNFVGKNLHANVLFASVYASLLGSPSVLSPGSIAMASYLSPLTGERMELSFGGLTISGNYVIFFQLNQAGKHFNGYVKLKDKDPMTDPDFSYNLNENPSDVLGLAAQALNIRAALSAFKIPHPFIPNVTFSPFFEAVPGFTALPPGSTPASASHYFNANANPGHTFGSMNMHKVVTDRCQIMNSAGAPIPGLYVIDNSIVPTGIDTHSISSTAMLIGRVCARFALEDSANDRVDR